MKVALLYNARPEVIASSVPDDAFEEFDSTETIESIAGALRKLGVSSDRQAER